MKNHPIKIILAPDTFKESLSAAELCDAMDAGIKRVVEDAEVIHIPMADGGEGTVDALVSATGGRIEPAVVSGPLEDPITARYGILGNGATAVIEMAEASGLALVPPEQRDPLKTTTYGTGELILSALNRGCRKIIVGIGGSATTDCGTGMAQALGVRFLKDDGRQIEALMNGYLMGEVNDIDLTGLHPAVEQTEFLVACDVDNPLLGPRGAVYVYSPQKGASEDELEVLESRMRHVIGIIEDVTGRSVRDIPGTGAAGGLGAGLTAFLDAELKPGIDIVLEACKFRERIEGARLILTGEGKVDAQTAYGKTIAGVASIGNQMGIPVVVIGGQLSEGAEVLYESGVTSMFSICSGPMTLDYARENARKLVASSTERILRLFVENDIECKKADAK